MAIDGGHLLEDEACSTLQVHSGGPEGLVGYQPVSSIKASGHQSITQQGPVGVDAQLLRYNGIEMKLRVKA